MKNMNSLKILWILLIIAGVFLVFIGSYQFAFLDITSGLFVSMIGGGLVGAAIGMLKRLKS